MASQPERIVVVGAGHAGLQLCASLRQEGFQGSVVLVNNEAVAPYQRPPLSKAYLTGKLDELALQFRPSKFYTDNGIELIFDQALSIDRAGQRVILRDGEALRYDHLVLATGTHNRPLPVPGVDLDGVSGIKSLADARLLAPALQSTTDAVVVGAGFIGLEFAAVARDAGVRVHVIDLADRPMARAVTPAMSEFFRREHERSGVSFDFGQGLSHLLGKEGRVSEALTSNGHRFAAQLVVYGIGVVPNVSLAADAGLAIGNGIRVNEFLLSSDPSISAIGDVAAFPIASSADYMRLESVQNATDQARCVAARLCGRPAAYAALPWFWTDQGDLKLQIAGIGSGTDHTVCVGNVEAKQFSLLCFREDHLVAVESVNRAGDHMAARKILSKSIPLTPAEAASPTFDFKSWAAR